MQFHIAGAHPADAAKQRVERERQPRRHEEVEHGDQQQDRPEGMGRAHRLERLQRPDQAGGAHARAIGRVRHAEHGGRDRAEHGGGERGRQPDLRAAHDVRELQHRGADPLREQAAQPVVPVGGHGKADHLAAAADAGRAGGDAVDADGHADGSRGDRRGQRQADHHRDDDAHGDGLQLRSGVDERAQIRHERVDPRPDEDARQTAGADGDQRREHDVDGRFARHERAQLRAHHGAQIRADRAAERIAERTGRRRGEEHQRPHLHAPGGAHADGRAGGGADVRQRVEHGLRVRKERQLHDLPDDRADDERGEQAERHAPHCVDEVPLEQPLDHGVKPAFPFHSLNPSHPEE